MRVLFSTTKMTCPVTERKGLTVLYYSPFFNCFNVRVILHMNITTRNSNTSVLNFSVRFLKKNILPTYKS